MHFTAITAALVLAFASTASARPTGKTPITIPFMDEACLRTCAAKCVSDTGMDLETCATEICDCFDEKAYIDARPFEFHQFGAQKEDPLTGLRPGQLTKAQRQQLGIPADKKSNSAVPTTMTKRFARQVETKETGAPVAEKKETEVKQGKVKHKTPVPDEDEDETRVLKDEDEDKDESLTLEDENRILKDENRVLKYEARVLKDKSRVLRSETRVLKERTRALEDETRVLRDDISGLKHKLKEADPPCGCGKKCNASGVCVCNECEIDCVYKTLDGKGKGEKKNESS